MKNNSAPNVSCSSHNKDTEKISGNRDFLKEIENDNILNQFDFESDMSKFDETIYQDLPNILKNAVNILTDNAEKEVFFFGAIGVVSGILPNIHGFYDSKFYTPHIYSFLVGEYGEGKGILTKARVLALKIQKQKTDEYESQRIEYELNGDNGIKPKRCFLFIPANNSKSGIVRLLKESDEKGIMFITEADTLADILKQDYGNFSDILRSLFHHEGYEQYRTTNDEYSFIEKGYLAVVMSGTYDQLIKLIPTIENGLYSRFLYYNFTPQKGIFKNVFHKGKLNYTERFEDLSDKFLKIHEKLSLLEQPINFSLTEAQQEIFLVQFQKWKTELSELHYGDLDGSVNRLGLIAFRIMMQFSTLRILEKEDDFLPTEIICNNIDFVNALRIIQISKNNALKVYKFLPKKKNRYKNITNNAIVTIVVKYLYKLDPKKFSTRKLESFIGKSHTQIATMIKS
ncbi:MAG: DUF3987 domain-containing protein [Bacteroidota bacterium]|nr:DUF3987 domain-containing protein [Bacteroidota bacterium]